MVCTLDRPASLRRTVESLVAQDLAAEGYEIIVVANGPHGIEDLEVETKGRTIRYLHEPELGLSRARNKGLGAVSSPLVAFIDDDAVAEPAFLGGLLGAFDCLPAGPACVGGRVVPEWESPPPGWLRDGLLKFLGVVDLGEQRRAVDWPEEVLVGCNIAFRTADLRDMGGFDPMLGRRGRLLYGNEEIALEQQVREAGGAIVYEPAAVVRHGIPADRMTIAWFARRVFYQGLSDYTYSRRHGLRAARSKGGGNLSSILSQRLRSGIKGGARAPAALLSIPYIAGVVVGWLRGSVRH